MTVLDLAPPFSRAPSPLRALRRFLSLGRGAVAALPPRSGALAPRPAAVQLHRALRGICASHGIEVDVRGTRPAGPVVLVANHLSYLDPVLLGALWPCAPIAKHEFGRWPLLGTSAAALGVIFVDRGCPRSGARALLRARRALAEGIPVLGFPEGTTTAGDRVLPLRRGLFGLARLCGVPIVPVRIDYGDADLAWVGDQLFLPHYLRTAARHRITARVSLLPALFPRSDDAPEELARRAREFLTPRPRPGNPGEGSLKESHAAERLRLHPPRADALLSPPHRGRQGARESLQESQRRAARCPL